MKKLLLLMTLLASPLYALAGISISIGDPNFYGQIDIGGYRPQLYYASPVVVTPVPGAVYAPIYLRVPYGQYRDWRRYCRLYGACSRPVYFVRDDWYRNTYAPGWRRNHPPHYGHGWRRDDDRRWRDKHDWKDKRYKHDKRDHKDWERRDRD